MGDQTTPVRVLMLLHADASEREIELKRCIGDLVFYQRG